MHGAPAACDKVRRREGKKRADWISAYRASVWGLGLAQRSIRISLETGLSPTRTGRDYLRRAAVRNLERAGIARSAAMKMVGHKTESMYRRYSMVDAEVLEEAAVKLAMLQANEVSETRKAATEGS